MQATIEKLVYGGSGLARTVEGVVFVPRTVPGDVVEIDITSRKKDYSLGRAVQLLTASNDRRVPKCPNFETAGCCHWDHIRYPMQLNWKENIVRESLRRLGKIPFDDAIPRITGPEHHYRLRATFHVHRGALGFLRENSNMIVPIVECAALVPELNAFISHANALKLDAAKIDVVASGSAISATFHFFNRPPQRDTVLQIPGLTALTFLTGAQQFHYAQGPPAIDVMGFNYGLNSNAFFQANRFLLEPFIEEVVRQADASGKNVIELYSGSGFFSIPLASVARQLIAVESNPAAVRQARENARANQMWNTQFAIGNVDTILANALARPDVVVLNPPRTGTGLRVAERVAALRSLRLVYISCNPTTFAREAMVFLRKGYSLRRLTLIDQFPNTYHVELVAQFELQ